MGQYKLRVSIPDFVNDLKVEWQLAFIFILSEYDNYCLILNLGFMDLFVDRVCVIDGIQGS